MSQPTESMVHGSTAPITRLPSVDRCLRSDRIAALVEQHGHSFVVERVRSVLDAVRATLHDGASAGAAADETAIAAAVERACADDTAATLRPVLNLTGTVVHTNLGRAVLPRAALDHIARTLGGANNLEFDLDTGSRGDRDSLIEPLICELTGAEAATVVNNNAAAVLLTIAALARGREVIVSRGELVEIGGAFRMPDVMESAGAKLREVGTTNRTHARDYEQAIGPDTALLLKVHTSNYMIEGFTASVDEAELAEIAHRHGLPFATDLGSGALVDLSTWGLPREPLVSDSLRAGADVVTFSGDKLLGGPQAGIIAGKRDAIERIRRFPMKRALRLSKLPLAALEATLRLYRHPERLVEQLPTLRHLARDARTVRAMAERLAPLVASALGTDWQVEVVALRSQIGSGSLPVDRIESAGLAITPVARRGVGRALERLSRALLDLPVPVIARIAEDALRLDLRCLDDPAPLIAQLPALAARLAGAA